MSKFNDKSLVKIYHSNKCYSSIFTMPHLFHGRLRAIYYLNALASKPRSLAYKQGFPSQISVSTSLCFYLFVKLSTYNRYDFFESTNTQSK
jgi:hypothetical protein